MKIRTKKKKVKDQFVLVVGDDGAILCHYMGNKLVNRIFVDSPESQEIELFEKLLSTYPDQKISILVDVIEQSYTQNVLPPVSKIGVVSQVHRRMKRDLRADDLNNFMVLGRLSQGRRDWSVLFISLANTDPFKKWLDFTIKQDNKFSGVYLLPVESTQMNAELREKFVDQPVGKKVAPDWEVLILYNKSGGFRIVVFKEGKIIFTRLAQNIIGESIPEVVVGNLEQELQNTFEYIKRLGFKTELSCRTTIIAATEILEKIDVKSVKFGEVCLLSPFQASEMLGLPDSVAGRDKFADIFVATHFAASNKHLLTFSNQYTKKLEQIYLGLKALSVATLIILGAGFLMQGKQILQIFEIKQEIKTKELELKGQNMSLSATKDKLKKYDNASVDRMLAIYNIKKQLPSEKKQLLKVLAKVAPEFGRDKFITGIKFNTKYEQKTEQDGAIKKNLSNLKSSVGSYEVVIDMTFEVSEKDSSGFKATAELFRETLQKILPDYKVTYDKEPELAQTKSFESIVTGEIDMLDSKRVVVPAIIKIEYDGTKHSAHLGSPEYFSAFRGLNA